MLLENVVTRRVSEENASKSSLTRRVNKQGYLLLAPLEPNGPAKLSSPVVTDSKRRERPSTMPLSKESPAGDSVRSLDLSDFDLRFDRYRINQPRPIC